MKKTLTTVRPGEKLKTRTRRFWRNGNEGQQHHVVSPQRKQLEEESDVSPKMGIRETQELEQASRRFLVTMSPAMVVCWEDSCSYNDGEMELMHAMYCTLVLSFEVHCTVRGPEFDGFLTSPPTTAHVDLDTGAERSKCIVPKAKDARMWIFIWVEGRRIH